MPRAPRTLWVGRNDTRAAVHLPREGPGRRAGPASSWSAQGEVHRLPLPRIVTGGRDAEAKTRLRDGFCLCILLHKMELSMERDSRKLIRLLEQDGWVHVATKGRHRQCRHPVRTGRITVPHPNRDMKLGTVASIYRQAGWK